MQKFLSLLCVICFFTVASFSQELKTNVNNVPFRSSFYAELGGPGILFSANIDTRFKSSSFGWGVRGGLGFVTGDEVKEVNGINEYDLTSAVTVLAQLNYIFGKYSSPGSFEVGAGATYVSRELEFMNFYDDKTSKLFGTFSFMYRRQPPNGGFFWRAGFTPLFAKDYVQASGALSLGYSF